MRKDPAMSQMPTLVPAILSNRESIMLRARQSRTRGNSNTRPYGGWYFSDVILCKQEDAAAGHLLGYRVKPWPPICLPRHSRPASLLRGQAVGRGVFLSVR